MNSGDYVSKDKKTSEISNHFEFSKQVVYKGFFMFGLQVLFTLIIILWQPVAAQNAVALMNVSVPIYAVIFGGYFGKAGVENIQKIRYWGKEYDFTHQYQNDIQENG